MCFECLNMFALGPRSSQRICNAWTLETCPAHPCTVHVVDQDWALLIVAGSNCNGPSDELVSANVCYESHSYHIRMPQALQVASKQYPRTFQNFQWYKGRHKSRNYAWIEADAVPLRKTLWHPQRRHLLIGIPHRPCNTTRMLLLVILSKSEWIKVPKSERRNLNGILKLIRCLNPQTSPEKGFKGCKHPLARYLEDFGCLGCRDLQIPQKPRIQWSHAGFSWSIDKWGM